MEGTPINLWLDDVRPAPEGWVWVKTVEEAAEIFAEGNVVRCSLDHDLGLIPGTPYAQMESNGMALVKWMIRCLPPVHWPHTIYIHSHNKDGADEMYNKLSSYAPRLIDILRTPFDESMMERRAIV